MGKEMPLISIIVPIYNVERYVKKSIESIQNQTYKNLEIILIDDGSTDSSGKICDYFSGRDKRIVVRHKENGGQGTARNMGLDICKGEYIAFLDSDDSMEATCIESLYSFMMDENLDISACNCGRYDEEGNLISLFEECYKDFIVDGMEAQRRIWYAECINLAPWGKLYRRELWENIRFAECRYCEDYATMHKIYLYVKRFGYKHEPQVRYLVRKNSSVRSFNELKLLTLDIADETIEYCKKNAPEALDAAIKKAVNMYFHNYLNMPVNKPEYENYYQRIRLFIKKYRWHILMDNRADKKVKVALIISLFGHNITKSVFSWKKRKNILF